MWGDESLIYDSYMDFDVLDEKRSSRLRVDLWGVWRSARSRSARRNCVGQECRDPCVQGVTAEESVEVRQPQGICSPVMRQPAMHAQLKLTAVYNRTCTIESENHAKAKNKTFEQHIVTALVTPSYLPLSQPLLTSRSLLGLRNPAKQTAFRRVDSMQDAAGESGSRSKGRQRAKVVVLVGWKARGEAGQGFHGLSCLKLRGTMNRLCGQHCCDQLTTVGQQDV